MRSRPITLLILIAGVTLLLAACTTADDDDVAEVADDTVAEATDDAVDPADATDDAEVDVEATDDATAEATEEAADDAVVAEETDDAAVEDDDAVEVADDATDDAAEQVGIDEDQLNAVLAAVGFDSIEEAEAPELDVATLQAEAPGMTFQAEAYDNVYVGAVTEDLYIGISLDSMYADQAESISAYVCDGDGIGFYVTGEFENGQATLALSEDAHIDLSVNGATIAGSVVLNGEELQAFEANEATGDAGLYVATETIEDVETVGRWIVLEDGSQRGQWCIVIYVDGWPVEWLCFDRK